MCKTVFSFNSIKLINIDALEEWYFPKAHFVNLLSHDAYLQWWGIRAATLSIREDGSSYSQGIITSIRYVIWSNILM